MRLFASIAVTAAALTAASSAAAVASFVTPDRAAYCGVSEGEPPLHLICWRPADGLTLDMTKRGQAQKRLYRSNRGYHDPATGRLLRFGQTWTLRNYWKCASGSSGLTCTNRSRHGWWVGRLRGYRML